MKNLQEILVKITQLTQTIETQYPELYQFLDEDPITISTKLHPKLNKHDFQEYLESLNQLLEHHIETHKKNKSNQNG